MSNLHDDANNFINDGFKLIENLSVVIWNNLMKFFIFIKIMPLFQAYPKLFVVLFLIMSCLQPPLTVFYLIIGFVALSREPNKENNFMVLTKLEQDKKDQELQEKLNNEYLNSDWHKNEVRKCTEYFNQIKN